MNFFEKWVVNKFIKGYLRNGLDMLSGPLNGKKSEIATILIALLYSLQQITGVESINDAIQLIIDQIAALGDTSLDTALNVTLGALIAVFIPHRVLKQLPKDDDETKPPS